MKILDRREVAAHEERCCQVPGCKHLTQGAKPFCSWHVELHPYVQRLLSRLEQREDERRPRAGLLMSAAFL